jgi:hypothetical protein
MMPQLAYGTVRDHPRKVIHVVRVLDGPLDYPEIDHLAEEMRVHVRSRHGEQSPDIVIVQGDKQGNAALVRRAACGHPGSRRVISCRRALVAVAARLTALECSNPNPGLFGCSNRSVSAKTD